MATDLIYIVRPGDANDELRYSLRSADDHAHADTPIIFGHIPAWIDGQLIAGVTVHQDPHRKALNAWRNLNTALSCDWLEDHIVIMNDDFYLTADIKEWRPTSPGTLRETLGETAGTMGRYLQAQHATLTFLAGQGITDPISFEGHTPFPVRRPELAQTLQWMTRQLEQTGAENIARLLWRTIHGNIHHLDPILYPQAKVSSLAAEPPYPTPYVSTNDSTFLRGRIGAWLREQWPDPSPWELDRDRLYSVPRAPRG